MSKTFENIRENADDARAELIQLHTNLGIIGYKSSTPEEREKKLRTVFKKMNKDVLIEQTLSIMKVLGQARTSLDDTLDYWDKDSDDDEDNNTPHAMKSKPSPTMDKDLLEEFDKGLKTHLDKISQKLTSWGDDIVLNMNSVVKEGVENAIPDIVKEAVKEIAKTPKFAKPWSDLFKRTQEDFKVEANKVFKETLSSALIENQHEVIQQVQGKQDYDNFERDKRSRNLIIGSIPESESVIAAERRTHDIDYVKRICKIDEDVIVKCIRAGAASEDKQRPVIVTVSSPNAAKDLHRYGNGNRVLLEGRVYWVNADLTQNERRMNYEARQMKRARQISNSQKSAT